MFRLSAQKRQGVLQDYNEFFSDGLAKGETEAALCKKFGNPFEIAREISEGEINKNVYSYGITFVLLLFMLLFLFSAEINYVAQISYRYIITALSLIAVVLCAKPINCVIKKLQKIVTVFFFAASIAFLSWNVLLFNIFNINSTDASNILAYSYYFCCIIAVISIYFFIVNIKNISKKFLALLPFLFYITLSMCEQLIMMGNVNSIANFTPIQSLLISALYIAPSFVLSVFLAFRKVRV